ncbi:MAG: cell division protein ZapE [Gammaproteobacteria bacterium]|nr:cell division protein ZapE [Gammaproteobacteria bacterium]
MTPSNLLEKAISRDGYSPDPAQQAAIIAFQNVYDSLNQQTSPANWFEKLLIQLGIKKRHTHQGIYLWGDVGRGKTWLMNLFFNSLPFEQKTRIHFHHFMIGVHQHLATLKNQKNPLEIIAADFANQYRVLCLDEFIVTNIVDAMLLHGLLKALNKHQVTVIMTSNRTPDDLYPNGLQRERFLPAIELIKHTTQVIHLNGGIDHRATLSSQQKKYINESDIIKLEEKMHELSGKSIKHGHILDIQNRPVQTIACGDGIVWFDFDVLCNTPRAAQDYIQLAEQFHTLLLSNVPIMNEYMDDKARRFIYLIDALYDKQVKIIFSSEAAPEKLYNGDMLKFAFRRTLSRLIEMQSDKYNQITS